MENREELIPILATALQSRSTGDWLERLAAAKVPAAPVWSVKEALESELARHRGMRWGVEHPLIGLTELVGSPLQHLSQTPATPAGPPPLLGEHTAEILQAVLQYPRDEVERMAADGVLGLHSARPDPESA